MFWGFFLGEGKEKKKRPEEKDFLYIYTCSNMRVLHEIDCLWKQSLNQSSIVEGSDFTTDRSADFALWGLCPWALLSRQNNAAIMNKPESMSLFPSDD